MPYFLNSIAPKNQFTKTTHEKYFVDKSELIVKMNELVGTASQYVCITRPRRFGKTLNAMMLASYWEKIKPYIIGEKGTRGGNAAKNTRQFINGVFWILRNIHWKNVHP